MQLICSRCQKNYSVQEPRWHCDCGHYLDLQFQAEFPIDKITARIPSMWRYREAIPLVEESPVISLGEGFTPLLPVNIQGKTIHIKQEQLFPTGSFKDRGAALLISKIKSLGIQQVVEDSSGNAGSSVAAYCVAADIGCDIYVPAHTSPGKLSQIEAYGATLHKVPGSRENTADAAFKAAEQTYYASHTWNPFFFHGTKTFAFEVCEQLGWKAPDTVILPVGNGTLLLGAYIGFDELKRAEIIEDMPRIIAIQTENCAPLYKAFSSNSAEIPAIQTKPTIAEGIAIAEPLRGIQLVQAVKSTKGQFFTVNEAEILTAKTDMQRKGFYIEPTSATTVAGIKKYLATADHMKENERIVSVFTGHGLKSAKPVI